MNQINKSIQQIYTVDSILCISIAEQLVNLKILDLSEACITTLAENSFEGLTSLTILKLNRNQLTYLDNKLFEGLKSFRELSVDNNQFEGFSLAGFYLSNIRLALYNRSGEALAYVCLVLICIFIFRICVK